MRTTQQFSITLPHDMADAVESKMSRARSSPGTTPRSARSCATACALLERDVAVERWLREEVVAGHAEYLADPSNGVPAEEILARIKARRGAP